MTSSHREIIRGAEVDGVVFCDPSGKLESPDAHKKSEKDQLRALEAYWIAKGEQDGKKQGFDEGYQAGQQEGFKRGHQEGLQQGSVEGEKAGFERGSAEGGSEAREEIKLTLQSLQALMVAMNVGQEQLVDTVRHELVEFGITVAESILQQELANKEIYKKLVEELLDKARPIAKDGPIEVFVAPVECDSLKAILSDLDFEKEFIARLRIQPDRGVMEGDCRIETSMGLVNFVKQRHLDEFKQKTLEVSHEVPLHEPETAL